MRPKPGRAAPQQLGPWAPQQLVSTGAGAFHLSLAHPAHGHAHNERYRTSCAFTCVQGKVLRYMNDTHEHILHLHEHILHMHKHTCVYFAHALQYISTSCTCTSAFAKSTEKPILLGVGERVLLASSHNK
eukprot:586368-Pelagomonas_calceolata.AAC.1